MSFRSRRVILSTPFYMVFEFFLLKYAFSLIGGVDAIYLILIVILIGLIRLVPMFLEAKKSRKITRFLTTVDGIWMWVSVMLVIYVVVVYIINVFVSTSLLINAMLLAIIPILGVYNYHKAHKLVVNEVTLTLDNLSRDINIVQMSDVHFGSVRHKEVIHKIVGKLKELEDICELAIISGDLADGSSVVEKDDFIEFRDVNMPIIFTPGNHDFYPGVESVIDASKNAGIIVLDNDNFEFKNLNIYGLTYSFEDIEKPGVEEIKSKIDPDLVNIINYHVPYDWDEFSEMGFDIQLSGHTHGGQFYPAIYLANILYDYNMGLFKNNSGNYLHVTTGVGSMDLPMRWGTDSELVVLKLRKK